MKPSSAAHSGLSYASALGEDGSVWDRFDAGEPLSSEDHAAIRLAGAYATDVAAEVTTFA
ncbi:hypothetical protein WMF04_33175 [Sorangium sp. So ce260]|uniref:hypothetical protein n=1 Tax=Sorangium sp. So ce260 TaxID=3133291 RepID=UPI003F6434AB